MFTAAAPYFCTQPCYFGGPFALNLATDDKDALKLDVRDLEKRRRKRGVEGLQYWTPDVHVAAFALPAYARKVADKAIAEGRVNARSVKRPGRMPEAKPKTKRKARAA